MSVMIWCYPKADKKRYDVRRFDTETKADAWLLAHNHELLCFVPDYWSDVVSQAEAHCGERIGGIEEVNLF